MALPMQDCILLLGDSLTQRMDSPGNLHQRFAEAYQRKLDIQNRGFGGYNSAWVLPLMDYILAKKGQDVNTPRIRLVTIWLGTNDSVLEGREQYLPLDVFTANMSTIINAFTSPTSPYAVSDTPVSIVLITPGPPLHSQMAEDRRATRSVERTRQFRDEVIRLFGEYKEEEGKQEVEEGGYGWKIALLDFWNLLETEATADGSGAGLAPFYFDGLHLTTKGYTLLWDNLSNVIKTEFKGRGLDYDDFDDLPRRVPLHSDVDHTRPESVVERMALPKIRGGSGPIKVESRGFEG